MNNKSLTNLKFAWEVPGLGTFRIDTSATLRPDILKPLGWHTWSRVLFRKWRESGTNPVLLLNIFRNRHNVPKGWHA